MLGHEKGDSIERVGDNIKGNTAQWEKKKHMYWPGKITLGLDLTYFSLFIFNTWNFKQIFFRVLSQSQRTTGFQK